MRSWLPVLGTVALALCACGKGGGSGSDFGGGAIAVPPTFQAANMTGSFAAPGSGLPNLVPGGPSAASATFTSGTGITASGGVAGDTGANSVTLTTDSNGNLLTFAINIAPPGGTGPGVAQSFVGGTQGNTTLTPAQFAALLTAVAAAPATTANGVYQGTVAGLSYSAYGAWMQSNGGGSYNVGSYAFGRETTPAQMLHAGTANYTGTTLGFGSNGAAPFTFSGAVAIAVNFAVPSVTSFQISGITTQDVNDANPGPVIGTISGSGGIGGVSGNQYTFAIGGNAIPGGALSGTLNGTFFGPGAKETGGTYRAGNLANTFNLIGSYGAHH
jgi:hypothetical protein